MANIWTIARREYRQYFSTPIAYVIAAVILFVIGIIFVVNIDAVANGLTQQTPGVELILSPLGFMLVIALPALTMRLLAEENRQGTLELLLTSPVRDLEVVVGKWLGALLFVASLIGVTLIFPAVMNVLIEPGIDQGQMVAAYLGMVLVSSAFIALGVAVSSFFQSQVAAFVATLGLNLLLWWLSAIPGQLSGPEFSVLFSYLNFNSHFLNTMLRGVIELTDLVYYLSATAIGLMIGAVALETRRWR